MGRNSEGSQEVERDYYVRMVWQVEAEKARVSLRQRAGGHSLLLGGGRFQAKSRGKA